MAEEFTCAVAEAHRPACADLPEYQDTGYCVLHFPGKKNKEDLLKVKKSKLDRKDYYFGGTVFPEGTADFEGFQFDANANFTDATFIGGTRYSAEHTSFEGAQFNGEWTSFKRAKFSGKWTSFSWARFSGKWTFFEGAQFNGEGTDFSSAQFSGGETDFSSAQFSGEETDFSWAQFNRKRTDFSSARFNGKWTSFKGVQFSGGETDFSSAQFSGEETDFSSAQFSGKWTSFREAQFRGERTYFSEAEFGSVQTGFQKATFTMCVTFSEATFREKVTFWGTKENLVFDSQAWVWFHDCRIEKPELLAFNTVLLHPGWFINADVRKVDFTDVKWAGIFDEPEDDKPGDFKRAIQKLNGRVKDATEALKKRELAQAWRKLTANALDNEIEALKTRDNITSPHTLLAQACRRLSANAEGNHEYPLADEFHYWSMDALRKVNWRRLGLIGTFYWALSGYGERPRRAFLVLVGMGTLFAILYMMVAGSVEHVGQAFLYSLAAMVRLTGVPAMAPLTKLLQPSEPGLFQLLVTAEGILGPLQIALLALAVRRRVMR